MHVHMYIYIHWPDHIGYLPWWNVNAGAAGWPIRDLGDPQIPPVHCQALPAT